MDVDLMEAGRELDALVAERVIGAKWYAFTDPGDTGTSRILRLDSDARGSLRRGLIVPAQMDEPIDSFYGYDGLPRYSTDIGAAWEVAEKMVSDGHVFIVKGDGLRTGDFSPRWTVLCDNLPRTDADSAPLAICRAALKAQLKERDAETAS